MVWTAKQIWTPLASLSGLFSFPGPKERERNETDLKSIKYKRAMTLFFSLTADNFLIFFPAKMKKNRRTVASGIEGAHHQINDIRCK